MNFKLTAGFFYAVLILLFSACLRGFVEASLAACVIAIASWPRYRAFASRLPLPTRKGSYRLDGSRRAGQASWHSRERSRSGRNASGLDAWAQWDWLTARARPPLNGWT